MEKEEGGFPFWCGHSDKDWRAGWCWCHHFFSAICAVAVFFYGATYGTFLIEFFIIIDLTCIILLALAKQILTHFDIRTKNMLPISWGAIKQAEIILMIMYNLLATIKFLLFTWSKPSRDNVSLESLPFSLIFSNLPNECRRGLRSLPGSPCCALPDALVCLVDLPGASAQQSMGWSSLVGLEGCFSWKAHISGREHVCSCSWCFLLLFLRCFKHALFYFFKQCVGHTTWLSSAIRDWTCTPELEVWNLSHWTTGEIASGVSFWASSLKKSWWHSEGTALTWALPVLASFHCVPSTQGKDSAGLRDYVPFRACAPMYFRCQDPEFLPAQPRTHFCTQAYSLGLTSQESAMMLVHTLSSEGREEAVMAGAVCTAWTYGPRGLYMYEQGPSQCGREPGVGEDGVWPWVRHPLLLFTEELWGIWDLNLVFQVIMKVC